jgi:CYTH domain
LDYLRATVIGDVSLIRVQFGRLICALARGVSAVPEAGEPRVRGGGAESCRHPRAGADAVSARRLQTEGDFAGHSGKSRSRIERSLTSWRCFGAKTTRKQKDRTDWPIFDCIAELALWIGIDRWCDQFAFMTSTMIPHMASTMIPQKELELKFEVEPSTLRRFQPIKALKKLPKWTNEASVYFDTNRHKLHQKGLLLRVRRIGKHYVQTIKATGNSATVDRNEWETEISDTKPDLRC